MRDDRNELLDAEGMATRCGVGVDTIYRWKREGRLPEPAPMPGKALRWRVIDVDVWQAAGFRTDDVAERAAVLVARTSDYLGRLLADAKKLKGDMRRVAEAAVTALADREITLPVRHRIARNLLRNRWELGSRKTTPEESEILTKQVEALKNMREAAQNANPPIGMTTVEIANDLDDLLRNVELPERFQLLIGDIVADLVRKPTKAETAQYVKTAKAIEKVQRRQATPNN